MEVRAKKRFRTISEGEKIRKGLRRSYMYWDESKEAKRGTSVWAWTQFYHKPYANDWNEAYNKACERKWGVQTMSILSQKYKDMQFIQGGKQSKWDRLYNWLNDMRYGIAPDENTPDDERGEREAQVDVIDDIMEWIEKHPQEPKTGHWISRPHIYGVAFCSECGFELKINNTNYCPNCGCRMVEPQESEKV